MAVSCYYFPVVGYSCSGDRILYIKGDVLLEEFVAMVTGLEVSIATRETASCECLRMREEMRHTCNTESVCAWVNCVCGVHGL